MWLYVIFFFFFQAEDGIRDLTVTGVQTCALPISAARIAQIRFALPLERQVAPQLVGALLFAPRERLARIHEQLPLPRDAIAQFVHVVREQPILAADEVQILVAGQQIAKALRREQHLPAIERAALVNVDEPALQYRALFEQGVLRDQEVDRDLIDLAA